LFFSPCMLSCWQTPKYEAYGKFVLPATLEILTCQWIWNYLEYKHYYHVQTCPKTMIVNGFQDVQIKNLKIILADLSYKRAFITLYSCHLEILPIL
jgi:hypothetical protein